MEWSTAGEVLRLRVPSWPKALTLQRGPPRRDDASTGSSLQRASARAPAPAEQEQAAAVLRRHLRRIASLCRDAGARPVFLDYPGRGFAKPMAQQALRDVARELRLDFIDVASTFAASGATDDDACWVPDGHLSNRGYAMLGELVARDALESDATRASTPRWR